MRYFPMNPETSTRSDGPVFDGRIREEDVVGMILTGTTPIELSFSDLADTHVRTRRDPECERGIGLQREPIQTH
jgi:hypothetical protein